RARVPAVGLFRLQTRRAVEAVELVERRCLEALAPTGAQDGAAVEIPGRGELASEMVAEGLVLIFASAGGQREAFNHLAGDLGVIAVDPGCGKSRCGAADRAVLVLEPEHRIVAVGDGEISLIFDAVIVADIMAGAGNGRACVEEIAAIHA